MTRLAGASRTAILYHKGPSPTIQVFCEPHRYLGSGDRCADHVDYLHDGHLHHMHGNRVDEHSLAIDAKNPNQFTPNHNCGGHEPGHVHGPACGHEAVPHGDHVDYLVNGHLHHPHGDYCDDHGPVELV